MRAAEEPLKGDMDVAGLDGCGRGIRLVLEWGRAGSGLGVIRYGHLTAVVRAFLVGCAVVLVVGCTGVRSGASQEEQRHRTEATEEQARSPEATAR